MNEGLVEAAPAPARRPTRRVEVLHFPGQSDRATVALLGLARAAGAAATQTHRYLGGCDWLVLWGPGGSARQDVMRQQTAAGGHTICLDLAYWDRFRKIRVSFDAAHPQDWVLRKDWPGTRLQADHVQLRDDWNPKGSVILAGIGRKAREQYGDAVATWEAQMIAACRARGWDVRYRRKQLDAPVPSGVPQASGAPIDDVLRGASLVITWHSNVAVDAIRLGIPAVCRDGAAAAVCPSEIPEVIAPLAHALRRQFLQNLAWFQWHPKTESAACWAWIQAMLA